MNYLDKAGTQELINQLKAFVDQYTGSSSVSLQTSETDKGKTLTISEEKPSQLFLNSVYPVGAMYFTVDANFRPADTFGGTWERVEDRYLMLAGSKYAPGSTGGSDTHTLTVEEMPAHTHTLTVGTYTNRNVSTSLFGTAAPTSSSEKTVSTDSTGSGTPINIIPSYYGVIGWRRTA